MYYTVNKLAKLAGVSVRTLHYYDEIGLLKPSYVKDNGYRCYEEIELLRLQQILFFKELEFSLEDIIKIMNSPNFNRLEALHEQKKILVIKKKRIDKLIDTINNAVSEMKGGETMKNDDLFASFNDDELVKNMDEAKRRWGNTEAYKQSMERVKNWTKEDYKRIKKEGEEFTKKLADAMDLDIQDSKVQELVAVHHQSINYFYDCSYEMYRGLAELYVTDPRFTKYYDKHRAGLAAWLNKAINYYCDQHEQK